KGPFTEFDVFTTADPPARHLLDATLWTQLTESGSGGNVDVKMNRLPAGAGAANTVIDHDWTVANGSLRGTVYYWANNIGRVMRIKPDAGAPEDFLAAAGVNDNCSTCHSVSANGSTLIMGGDTATSTFDLLNNTSALSISSVGKPVRNWAMPAVSPDGSTVIENNAALPGPPGGSDAMFDAYTGQKLTGLGLDGIFLDMPAFAPDGSRIAFVDHNTGDLGVYAWDPATKMASSPQTLVAAGADPNLNCIAFPSVSPDAKWIVYHRGSYPGSLDTRSGPGSLYLASSENPGADIRLRQVNGDDYPFAAGTRDLNNNYEPTFAPLNAGGYAWVVYTSRRTYGNRLVGPANDTKQLWVAAIDQNPTPGEDPSHPAFRVPGQDIGTWNMRGFWALEPCKQVGEECTTGSQCCNQNCVDGFCEEPDPGGCSETGNACEETADCCDPNATCVNGFCSEPPPE
ncbi:MAG: PD40 domain-containing protein, partial [Myxococcales bacterium]|nr:PD40 domain-containing protein [Myxococcales bacterium]